MLEYTRHQQVSGPQHEGQDGVRSYPAVRFIDCNPRQDDFRGDVLAGLRAYPKRLEPKFFYDEKGSRLFEQISQLPEYYPTRTEMAILERHAHAIREAAGEEVLLIEFGSGSGRKVRLLLDSLRPAGYVAIDISGSQLLQACSELASLYPCLDITAVHADYSQAFTQLAAELESPVRRLAFFPGSTIGNFTPGDALAFLRHVRSLVGADGGLLIGVDMKKDKSLLHAAYNDSAGVTAAFNLNLLHRINRELDADFDVSQFEHHAFYNEAQGRMEMHLRSLCAQCVHIEKETIFFERDETIHTENSCKYTREEFAALAEHAGFGVRQVWQDGRQWFSVFHLGAV